MNSVLNDLFVLEMAQNHQGSVQRGLEIIHALSEIVKRYGIKAAIKLQVRDKATFVHKDYHTSQERYIRRTLDLSLTFADYAILAQAIRDAGMIVAATAFDERSVRFCQEIGVEIFKVASSDINDVPLLCELCSLPAHIPIIISTGGSTSLVTIDKCLERLRWWEREYIGVNHCVSIYPSEMEDLQLWRVGELSRVYSGRKGFTIGWSSHEVTTPYSSIKMAYAMGARTFEIHCDLKTNKWNHSSYDLADSIASFNHAKSMFGTPHQSRNPKEEEYLSKLRRGAYAARTIPAGIDIKPQDVYWAIPSQEGQATCQSDLVGRVAESSIKQGEPIPAGLKKLAYRTYLASTPSPIPLD